VSRRAWRTDPDHVAGAPVWQQRASGSTNCDNADRPNDWLRYSLPPGHRRDMERTIAWCHGEALAEDRERTLDRKQHAWMAAGLTSAERKQRMIEEEEHRLQEYAAWCRRAATVTAVRLFGDEER
jgi:hypothetical protein